MNDIGMTEWDRRSDSQNRHLIQLILMSCVSFRHHPIAVYNGEDSLMTPKWGPRQVRSGQLSLTKTHVYFFLSQAHSLTTEYSTSGSQKVIYLLAAIGKPTHQIHPTPPHPHPSFGKVGEDPRMISVNRTFKMHWSSHFAFCSKHSFNPIGAGKNHAGSCGYVRL